jgi:hypothetical protein
MKKLSTLGMIIGAALLCAVPIDAFVTNEGGAVVS